MKATPAMLAASGQGLIAVAIPSVSASVKAQEDMGPGTGQGMDEGSRMKDKVDTS